MRRSFFIGCSLLSMHLFHVASLQAQCDCGKKKHSVEKSVNKGLSFRGGCSCEGSSLGDRDLPEDEQ